MRTDACAETHLEPDARRFAGAAGETGLAAVLATSWFAVAAGAAVVPEEAVVAPPAAPAISEGRGARGGDGNLRVEPVRGVVVHIILRRVHHRGGEDRRRARVARRARGRRGDRRGLRGSEFLPPRARGRARRRGHRSTRRCPRGGQPRVRLRRSSRFNGQRLGGVDDAGTRGRENDTETRRARSACASIARRRCDADGRSGDATGWRDARRPTRRAFRRTQRANFRVRPSARLDARGFFGVDWAPSLALSAPGRTRARRLRFAFARSSPRPVAMAIGAPTHSDEDSELSDLDGDDTIGFDSDFRTPLPEREGARGPRPDARRRPDARLRRRRRRVLRRGRRGPERRRRARFRRHAVRDFPVPRPPARSARRSVPTDLSSRSGARTASSARTTPPPAVPPPSSTPRHTTTRTRPAASSPPFVPPRRRGRRRQPRQQPRQRRSRRDIRGSRSSTGTPPPARSSATPSSKRTTKRSRWTYARTVARSPPRDRTRPCARTTRRLGARRPGLPSGSADGRADRIFAVRYLDDAADVVASAGWDNTLTVWDARAGPRPARIIRGPSVCGDAVDARSVTARRDTHRILARQARRAAVGSRHGARTRGRAVRRA